MGLPAVADYGSVASFRQNSLPLVLVRMGSVPSKDRMLAAPREQDPLYLVEVTGYPFRVHIDQMPATATGVPLQLLSNCRTGFPRSRLRRGPVLLRDVSAPVASYYMEGLRPLY